MYLTERKFDEKAPEYALRTIKDNIVRLEIKPGSTISENELATQIGVSRTPIREALKELERTKIVEIYPQKGCKVALVDYELVDEACFMRRVLECEVVRVLSGNLTPEQKLLLETNLHMQRFHYENDLASEFFEYDNEFHKMLFAFVNKKQVYTLMNSMMVHFDRVRYIAVFEVKTGKLLSDHERLFKAMVDGDEKLAVEIMTMHLGRCTVDQSNIYNNYPQYCKNV